MSWLRPLLTLLMVVLAGAPAKADGRCDRIVSLAPSITESLFALGLGPQVVGVTRYCTFPPEVKELPHIGGFFDPNFEAIAQLKPTMAFYLSEFGERARTIGALSVATCAVDQRTRTGILQSIQTLGAVCGSEAAARKLVSALQEREREIQARVKDRPLVRTLVVVGSESIDSLRSLYVSGQDGFYDELIRLAGGANVITGTTRSARGISLEVLVQLNPEVIVEIHPDYPDEAEGSRRARAAWTEFPSMAAVKNNRVHVLSGPSSYIPGPRYTELLERLARVIHPEAF